MSKSGDAGTIGSARSDARALDQIVAGTAWTQGPRAGDLRWHEHYRVLGSTNDRALAWLAEGAPHGAVVTCDRQDAGRGRLGRSWESNEGLDLAMTMLLRPSMTPHSVGALGLAVALGVREGIEQALGGAAQRVMAGLSSPRRGDRLHASSGQAAASIDAMRRALVEIKWPNDLLIDGAKVAGILCEARWQSGRGEFVAGVGVNVGASKFPELLQATATSLALLYGEHRPGRAELLQRMVPAIETWTAAFFAGGFPAIRSHYEQACSMKGRIIEVSLPERPTQGGAANHRLRVSRQRVLALGFDDDGALLIADEQGGMPRRFESGDVWFATPS